MIRIALLLLALTGTVMAKDGQIQAPKPTARQTQSVTHEQQMQSILQRLDEGDEAAWEEMFKIREQLDQQKQATPQLSLPQYPTR